jgi:hypothetical protein
MIRKSPEGEMQMEKFNGPGGVCAACANEPTIRSWTGSFWAGAPYWVVNFDPDDKEGEKAGYGPMYRYYVDHECDYVGGIPWNRFTRRMVNITAERDI